MPASSSTLTKLTADSGVSDDGLNTTVLPHTSAGMIFHDGIAIGKFHGVITAQTPSGWRTDIANLSRSSDGTVWPYRRRPSPAMKNVMSIASWTSPRVSSRTLPISRVMSRANCSLRSAISCAARNSISARRGAGTRRQLAYARSAARNRVLGVLRRRLLKERQSGRRGSPGSGSRRDGPTTTAVHRPSTKLLKTALAVALRVIA